MIAEASQPAKEPSEEDAVLQRIRYQEMRPASYQLSRFGGAAGVKPMRQVAKFGERGKPMQHRTPELAPAHSAAPLHVGKH